MAKRVIQPVELGASETTLVKGIQKKAAKALKKKVSASEVLRRCVRIAGPKLLSGEEPIVEAVCLGETAK